MVPKELLQASIVHGKQGCDLAATPTGEGSFHELIARHVPVRLTSIQNGSKLMAVHLIYPA